MTISEGAPAWAPISASPDPALYEWDTDDGHTGGVSDNPAAAAQHLVDALADTPVGTEGHVRKVALTSACPPEYTSLREVARARHLLSGTVQLWTEP